jgi:hypothetical protein
VACDPQDVFLDVAANITSHMKMEIRSSCVDVGGQRADVAGKG